MTLFSLQASSTETITFSTYNFFDLRRCHDFDDIILLYLRGEDMKFYISSQLRIRLYCNPKMFLSFAHNYFLNKRRIIKDYYKNKLFSIPLLVRPDGKIARIGWAADWDKESYKRGLSDSVNLLRYGCKFIELYAILGEYGAESEVSSRTTAGSKHQREQRDPLSLKLRCGSYETAGTRSYMEDRIYTCLDLFGTCSRNPSFSKHRMAFVGVYDGHNGEYTVEFLKNYLHKNFVSSFENDSNSDTIQSTVKALFAAFNTTENQIRQHYVSTGSCSSSHENEIFCQHDCSQHISSNNICNSSFCSFVKHISSGSTALVCCVVSSTLCIGNLGDSRALLCKGGRAHPLTNDHRIKTNHEERGRVEKEGGTFDDEGYLGGSLAVSRAFGNWDRNSGTKLLGVSSIPEIFIHHITREDEFLVIACDGVFESITNQEVISIIRRSLIETNDPNIAAEKLAKIALQRQSLDNLSIVILVLTSPEIPTNSGLQQPSQLSETLKQNNSSNSIGDHLSKRKIYNFSQLKSFLQQ
ncbi:putative protein phosphatase 2C [Cryptosporidium serpentis]